MIRFIQLLIVLIAAIPAAGCTACAIIEKRLELKAIEREWGFFKPHNTSIYQP